jgi:ABC-type transport system substrate-binding protein
MAGEVDFCMRSTISFDGATILREQWEKQGKGKVLTSPASWTWLNLSRDNPWFSDVKVRRALLHAIDRDAMTQNIFKGERIVSHMPLSRVRRATRKLWRPRPCKYDPETAKNLSPKRAGSRDRTAFWLILKASAWNSSFASRRNGATHEQAQAIIADH